MKSQYTFKILLSNISIIVFVLTFNCKDTCGALKLGQSNINLTIGSESCKDPTGSYVIGLKPYLPDEESESEVLEACKQIWYCRVTSLPGDETTSKQLVTAFLYSCADADPKRPFYDPETCQCVSSNDHCNFNRMNDHQFDCTRNYNEKKGERYEDCRSFGEEEKYYLDDFVHAQDQTKFWKCSPKNDHSTWAHVPLPCPSASGVVWDSSSCKCIDSSNDEDEEYRIHQANLHPMNRFKCATEFQHGNICLDTNGTYYTGYFPEGNPWNQNIYWECVVHNETELSDFSVPDKRKCPEGLIFNIHGCNCTSPEDVDVEENLDPQNRYNCAEVLDVDPEGEQPCKDRNGLYHIGIIPNANDCSAFYSCIHSNDPIERATPVLRQCPKILKFNVLTCDCQQPSSFECGVNLDPKNTFRCANETISGSPWGKSYGLLQTEIF